MNTGEVVQGQNGSQHKLARASSHLASLATFPGANNWVPHVGPHGQHNSEDLYQLPGGGGTKSRFLMCGVSLLFLRVEHLAEAKNMVADWLSHQQLSDTEWQLHLEAFHQMTQKWGVTTVNFFASKQNTQLTRFFPWTWSKDTEGLDTLLYSWPPGLLYAFPPIQILPLVLKKIIRQRRFYWLHTGRDVRGFPL